MCTRPDPSSIFKCLEQTNHINALSQGNLDALMVPSLLDLSSDRAMRILADPPANLLLLATRSLISEGATLLT